MSKGRLYKKDATATISIYANATQGDLRAVNNKTVFIESVDNDKQLCLANLHGTYAIDKPESITINADWKQFAKVYLKNEDHSLVVANATNSATVAANHTYAGVLIKAHNTSDNEIIIALNV